MSSTFLNSISTQSSSIKFKKNELKHLLNEFSGNLNPLKNLDKESIKKIEDLISKYGKDVALGAITPPKRLLAAALGIAAQSGFSPQAQAEYEQHIGSLLPIKMASILPFGIGSGTSKQAQILGSAIALDPRVLATRT